MQQIVIIDETKTTHPIAISSEEISFCMNSYNYEGHRVECLENKFKNEHKHYVSCHC